ncbi:uncharacterized protein E6C27_scaffold708G00940 [Cucumis melo var. makuwa]|uniref:Uncharacterized protein n=1 Tax=Cucumis melo var. makuwa TaxID=1194695 RepID=A0A5A7SUI4_CUCMM|nr:uncharacterized protein E6C27_scaffold708G00940 [Cucumis melo var. makuwa]
MQQIRVMKKETTIEHKGLLYGSVQIEGKEATTMFDTGASHNFMDVQEAKSQGSTSEDWRLAEETRLLRSAHGRLSHCTWLGEASKDVVSITIQKRGFEEPMLRSNHEDLRNRRSKSEEPSVPDNKQKVLDEYKDIMPSELPKKLPPKGK